MSVTWESPPNQRVIGNFDAGTVVLVRFAPSSPSAVLVADATGVLPHLVFRATLAPAGTTAFQQFAEDPISGLIMATETQGERPTTYLDDPLTRDAGHSDFDLDAGQAIFLPYPGTMSLKGGAIAVGTTAPYEVNVQVVTPRVVDMEYADPVIALGTAWRRHVFHQTGLIPRKRPTMTFAGVGATLLQVPRGAVSVQVATAQNITFNFGGLPPPLGPVATVVALQPGHPMPLGAFSQAKFSAAGGGTIDWISFEVEL